MSGLPKTILAKPLSRLYAVYGLAIDFSRYFLSLTNDVHPRIQRGLEKVLEAADTVNKTPFDQRPDLIDKLWPLFEAVRAIRVEFARAGMLITALPETAYAQTLAEQVISLTSDRLMEPLGGTDPGHIQEALQNINAILEGTQVDETLVSQIYSKWVFYDIVGFRPIPDDLPYAFRAVWLIPNEKLALDLLDPYVYGVPEVPEP